MEWKTCSSPTKYRGCFVTITKRNVYTYQVALVDRTPVIIDAGFVEWDRGCFYGSSKCTGELARTKQIHMYIYVYMNR